MLQNLIRSYSPEWAVQLLQKSLYNIRRHSPVEITPFDELFSETLKTHYTASQKIPTPEVEQMEFLDDARYLKSLLYTVPEDYVAELDDLTFCPNNSVLMTPEGKVISESLNTGGVENLVMKDFFYLYRTNYISGYSTPLRSRYSNYYHTLVDGIPRLLALNRSPYTELDEIKLLCPGGLTALEEHLVVRLGPDNLRIISPDMGSRHRLEKTLFTPFKTQKFAGYWPEQYVKTFRDRVLPDRPSKRRHRLFISREETYIRMIENREELQVELEDLGFRTVIPENLPIEEQIELFYDAEMVVATHGSGLTNMLFSPHLRIVELFPTRHMIPHYYYLSKSLGHDYAYWCGTGSYRNTKAFYVNVPEVLDILTQSDVDRTVPSLNMDPSPVTDK